MPKLIRFVPEPPFPAWMYQQFLKLAGLPFDHSMLTFGGCHKPDKVCGECGAACDIGSMNHMDQFICAMPCKPY